MSSVKVGRDGFKGSSITDWCSGCGDWVVRLNTGACGWCDLKIGPSRAQLDLDAEIARLRDTGLDAKTIGSQLGMDGRVVRGRLARLERVAV